MFSIAPGIGMKKKINDCNDVNWWSSSSSTSSSSIYIYMYIAIAL